MTASVLIQHLPDGRLVIPEHSEARGTVTRGSPIPARLMESGRPDDLDSWTMVGQLLDFKWRAARDYSEHSSDMDLTFLAARVRRGPLPDRPLSITDCPRLDA